jgi:hypothetical protein
MLSLSDVQLLQWTQQRIQTLSNKARKIHSANDNLLYQKPESGPTLLHVKLHKELDANINGLIPTWAAHR